MHGQTPREGDCGVGWRSPRQEVEKGAGVSRRSSSSSHLCPIRSSTWRYSHLLTGARNMVGRGSNLAGGRSTVPHVREEHHEDGDEDDADRRDGSSPRPHKRPRKQRPCYSCQECRRLKMRCDRQGETAGVRHPVPDCSCDLAVPCHNCVRRGRAELCAIPAVAPVSSRFVGCIADSLNVHS